MGCFVGLLVAAFFVAVRWAFKVCWSMPSARQPRVDPRVEPDLGSVRIEDEIHGRPFEVRFDRDLEGGSVYTRVVVDLRGQSPGMLKIAPPGYATRIAQMFGDQDIVIGDPAFDEHFIIMANPESLAHRVFAPERRARMISAIWRIGGAWAPFVDLTAETLNVGVVAHLQKPKAIRDLVAAAREFVEVFREIGAATGIVWVDSPTRAVGQCQVCGTEMVERVVKCAACRTPHHEECWVYAGECSTYACQETAYLKEGRRVEAGSRAKILRIERVDEGLRAPLRAFPQADESLARFERRV